VLERELDGRAFLLAAPVLAATRPVFAQDNDYDLPKILNGRMTPQAGAYASS
jgi:hypothetical protein